MQPIETPRLRIRPFVEDDLDAVARILDEGFGPVPRAQRQEWLDWSVRNHQALAALRQPPYGDLAVVLKSGGELVGSVGLVPSFGPFGKLPSLRSSRSSELFTPELGLFWAVGTAHRGKGYATEAARALVSFAFAGLGAERLVATTERENPSSIAVMRRLGMTIDENPDSEPHWFQVVGVHFNPALR